MLAEKIEQLVRESDEAIDGIVERIKREDPAYAIDSAAELAGLAAKDAASAKLMISQFVAAAVDKIADLETRMEGLEDERAAIAE